MEKQRNKCVLLIDEQLPIGMIANTSAILGATLAKIHPDIVGEDVYDNDKYTHMGIVNIPIPILKANKEVLKDMRKKLYMPEFQEVEAVDFSDVAQQCNDYDDYIKHAGETKEDDFIYLGIGLYGSKKLINKLTGSMPLLR